MMDEMPASLFLDWAEFDRVCLCISKEERADAQSGIVAWQSATHNYMWAKAHGGKGLTAPNIDDFIRPFDTGDRPTKRVQSVDEMKARLNAFAMAHNAFIAQKT